MLHSMRESGREKEREGREEMHATMWCIAQVGGVNERRRHYICCVHETCLRFLDRLDEQMHAKSSLYIDMALSSGQNRMSIRSCSS